jgi:hypothetical protein
MPSDLVFRCLMPVPCRYKTQPMPCPNSGWPYVGAKMPELRASFASRIVPHVVSLQAIRISRCELKLSGSGEGRDRSDCIGNRTDPLAPSKGPQQQHQS